MRDRLIELIKSRIENKTWCVQDLADYLLANGVIVPPCKVGDKMYYDGKRFASHCKGKIMESTVAFINTEVCSTFRGEVDMAFDFDCFGKTVFLSHEEAEKALEGSAK